MNRERILQIADDIEHSASFDQSWWHRCVAGYAVARYAPDTFKALAAGRHDGADWMEAGMEVLGIDEDTAEAMFTCAMNAPPPNSYQAADALREYVASPAGQPFKWTYAE